MDCELDIMVFACKYRVTKLAVIFSDLIAFVILICSVRFATRCILLLLRYSVIQFVLSDLEIKITVHRMLCNYKFNAI